MSSIQNARLQQLAGVSPVQQSPKTQQAPATHTGGPDFAAILSDRLKVSSHAQSRLQSRDIQLDAAKWNRVMEGVDRAAAKGAQESLVLLDETALVVSVKNRTVITVVDQAGLKDQVFTNIDSAVIV